VATTLVGWALVLLARGRDKACDNRPDKAGTLGYSLFGHTYRIRAARPDRRGVSTLRPQHHVDVCAQLPVPGYVQAASTSFTMRTAPEASSA
jgi:hypothetical protein